MSNNRLLSRMVRLSSIAVRSSRNAAHAYWRGLAALLRVATRRREHDVFEHAPLAGPEHRFDVDFAGRRMDFRDLMDTLSIGDRLRVLCDDGVLVAEKISQRRFKLIHSEMISKLIH